MHLWVIERVGTCVANVGTRSLHLVSTCHNSNVASGASSASSKPIAIADPRAETNRVRAALTGTTRPGKGSSPYGTPKVVVTFCARFPCKKGYRAYLAK